MSTQQTEAQNLQYILEYKLGLIVFCARCATCALECQCAVYAQDCTSSPMRNICARFAQDCTYFPIVLISPMHNVFARLYLFPQCAIYAQDCTYFSNAQYMRKIVLISPVRNIRARLYIFLQCARFAQDCTSFWNAQYMHKICARSHLTSNLPIGDMLSSGFKGVHS